MGFRISDVTIFNDAIRHTRLNRFALSELQSAISSGKRLNSLADDPSSAAKVLGLRRAVARIDQFDRNSDSASSMLENTETALSTLTDVLIRLRELAVSADIEDAQFNQIKPEVEQLFSEVLRLANTRINGQYIFGGFVTDTPPFSQAGVFTDGNAALPTITSNGDNEAVMVQIGESAASRIQVNVPGREVFFGALDTVDDVPDGGRVNIFDVVRDLRTALDNPGVPNRPVDLLPQLDQALNQVNQVRGRNGARLNRLEITSNQLSALQASIELQRSKLEDLDIISAISDLQSREATFQASLAVTARVIQPSLLTFLG